MGITGLLPYLAYATRQCHVSEFRGGTMAIDSYCLLHKGANSCAEQLARGEDCQMYVDYCIKYVKMLLSYDIHPIMVFDGRNLPAKAETEAKRRESRKKAKQRAVELLKLGKSDEAKTYLKQCIDITPKMAHNLIKACRQLKVDCIVAPYESDAQLAFFNIKGVAECVITEDSDLVLFGCKKVLYKLDLSGAGRLVESDKIPSAMKMRPDQFTFDKFRFMCILSGCDYVDSLNGIGLKKAEKFVKLTAETNPEIFLDRIPRYLNMKHLIVTEEYKKSVLIANATFLHQVVFDPYKNKLVHLHNPELTGTNPEHLVNAGEKFDNKKALQVALGNINPYNFEEHDDWTPSDLAPYSIWSGVYKKRISHKQEKEIQRAKLQEFVHKESVRSHCSKINEDLQVIEEEYQIDKELTLYTKKHEDKVEIQDVEIEKCEEVTSKKEVSPVVANNPFLKRKRISKFPRTFTYGNTVVKSRFFHSESSVRTETVTRDEDSECENESKIIEEELTVIDQSETSQENGLEANKIDDCNPSDEVLKSCENTTVVSKKRSLEETVLKDVHENEDNLIERVLQIDLVEVDEKVTILYGKDTEQPHDTKRRKLGPCRTIGLRKKPAGQQTLHNFFGRLKKSE